MRKKACAAMAVAATVTALAVGLPSAAHAKEGEAGGFRLQELVGDPEGLTIGGSVRLRYEALDNQFRPGLDEKDDAFVIRTLVRAEYDTGPVRFAAEMQDSRAYDTDAGSPVGTSEVNTFELINAYVGFDIGGTAKKPAATLEVGRFTMDLLNRRLVARNAFRNTINSFTGARLKVAGPAGSSLTAFYTMPQVRLPGDKDDILDNKVKWDRESNDLVFWGGVLDMPLPRQGPLLNLAFFALDEQDGPDLATRDRKLYTANARLFRKPAPGHFDYEFEAAYQFGSISSGTAANAARLDVSASFVHAVAGYQWSGGWKPRISLAWDLAAGDKGAGSYNRFDTLFGARRWEFGPTSLYGALGRANLNTPGVFVEASPSARTSLSAAYRAAWLDSATDSFSSTGVKDGSGASGKFAGHQVEARVRHWLVPKFLQAELGGAVLFNGRFLKDAPNANGFGNTAYGYAQLEMTF